MNVVMLREKEQVCSLCLKKIEVLRRGLGRLRRRWRIDVSPLAVTVVADVLFVAGVGESTVLHGYLRGHGGRRHGDRKFGRFPWRQRADITAQRGAFGATRAG